MKFILTIILMLWCFPCEAQWLKLKPIRSVKPRGILGDIESHMPAQHIYRDNDKVTWAHETTHGLNSRLRQSYSSGHNVFYVLSNNGIKLREPPIKLSELARSVPTQYRGSIYTLYLVQAQQWWNDQPLYIVDEWVAYTNGTLCGIENRMNSRTQNSFEHALECGIYTSVLMTLVEKQRSYDSKYLRSFYKWHLKRMQNIYKVLEEEGLTTKKHKQYLEILLK